MTRQKIRTHNAQCLLSVFIYMYLQYITWSICLNLHPPARDASEVSHNESVDVEGPESARGQRQVCQLITLTTQNKHSKQKG